MPLTPWQGGGQRRRRRLMMSDEEKELNTLFDQVIRTAQVGKTKADVRDKKQLLKKICDLTERFMVE